MQNIVIIRSFFSMNVHHPSVLGVAFIPKKVVLKSVLNFKGKVQFFQRYCTGEYYYACSSHSIVLEVAKLVLFPNVVRSMKKIVT